VKVGVVVDSESPDMPTELIGEFGDLCECSVLGTAGSRKDDVRAGADHVTGCPACPELVEEALVVRDTAEVCRKHAGIWRDRARPADEPGLESA
jgi:hypothetical protein